MDRRAHIVVLIALLVLSIAAPAFGQQDGIIVRSVSVDEFPRVKVQMDVPVVGSDEDSQADVRVVENGRSAEVISAKAVPAEPVDVFLVVDTSGSMKGASLQAAKSAASAFMQELQAGSRVSIIAFSATASMVTPMAVDAGTVVPAAVESLQATGETALYDALCLTARESLRAGARRPIAVVLSDGGDTVSRNSLDGAIKELRGAGIPVLVVGLPSAEADSAVLETIASQTGGRFVGITQLDMLTETYRDIARGLQTTWDVTYVSHRPATKDIDVEIALTQAGQTIVGSTIVANPLFDPESSNGDIALKPVPPASVITLAGAGLLVFLAMFAFVTGIALIVVRPRTALTTLKFYDQMQAGDIAAASEDYSSKVTSSLVGAVDYLAGKHGIKRFVYEQLDRAGWPLRPAEYITMHLAIVIGAGGAASLLSGSFILSLLAVLLATVVPLAIVDARIRSRGNAFAQQLPDVLALIAGALRAGWGLQQSIDLVVEQMSPPVSSEFARAQTEVRLGRQVEDALATVAQRTQSEDFTWAVTAIGIQRDVGGNLAEVLDVVAATIRDRQALKRQISSLTAEGRLSAWILLLLPFVLIGALLMLNPNYLSGLFHGDGMLMLVIGVVLLVIGALWLRKIVTIEV